MTIVVRKAKEKDMLPIQRLVAKAGLRDEGIDQYIKSFLVVEDQEQQLIGTVGIEQYEENGLLRSLVLDSPIWNASLSFEFLQLTLKYAQEQQIETVYLCAKGTNALFHQLGFRVVAKEDVPSDVQSSPHFKRNAKAETKVWACELLD
ncbi:GNAT family N-acetyltransferase [Halalkalibacter kiskunsagensis]|uniref:GNAT family N-acetyltransferase n=1 Tax=Halalkalibacter kiskunsagensis TaxID=1548599 RepID=A0ABV6KFI9_9BACI